MKPPDDVGPPDQDARHTAERRAESVDDAKYGRETDSGEEVETWVVDRVEGGVVVLVEETGGIVSEVSSELLADVAVEGAVLRVPVGDVGEPVWVRAERDSAGETERRRVAEERLETLKDRDPGGDIVV